MATGKSKSIVSGKNLQGRSAAAAASNKHAIAATKAVADSPDISPHASESRSSTATDRVLANIPVVYGDQVMDVVYGIHTQLQSLHQLPE